MLSPSLSATCHNLVKWPSVCHNSSSRHEELGDGAVKVVVFPPLYNPHFLSPACPPNPLACVGDITWLLAPSSRPPATVINSVNKWIMTGRLTGSHHWPWVLLEWPFFGLTKKPFWYHCWSTLGMMACLPGESRVLHMGKGEGGAVVTASKSILCCHCCFMNT